MLTTTAIANPVFLANVRRAMRLAGVRAIATGNRTPCATVTNRAGQVSAFVWLHLDNPKGAQFEVIDKHDRDITAAVRAAIKSTIN